MLEFKVNEEKRRLKDDFIDVTLNELAASYKFVSEQDAETKRYLLSKDAKEIDKDKFFEFKLKWIALFSDFTVAELRMIPIEGNELSNLSVEWLYDHCKQFLNQPESYLELKEFDHKGKTYNILEPLKTISGATMLFGNGNYRQFMLGSQLSNMANSQKNEKGIEGLKQLFALLYSDGNDSSHDIVKRADVFGNVNALYGWSAYFFFVQLVKKNKDYFLSYTIKNPKPQVAQELAIQQLRVLLLKTSFGRLLLSKLPKREFSILRT
jgi:hypothetical protein